MDRRHYNVSVAAGPPDLEKYQRCLRARGPAGRAGYGVHVRDGAHAPSCSSVHQYFGVAAAQRHVLLRQGGIIWHTQGSGKSIVMVLLARWILENLPNARVVIITDRDELDSQIEGVFTEAGETIYRTSSGRDLMHQLGQAAPRLLCSLVHKFGRRDVDDFEAFINDLEGQPSQTVGQVFVFVDECHRTQSGKLNRVMKAMLPNAVFIGFTGTPLLKKDKATSLEVFGGYIHTYKFSEAVADAVVLDLIYEARDIDQRLGSKDKIDAWFAAKTRGLNDWQKEELKRQWGTMQRVLSSRSRMDRVVNDILFDFSVKPRLSSERGNAILVASSIYEACKYFTLFQKTPLKGKCAVVTSYNPQAKDVTREETGADTETDRQFIYNNLKPATRGPAAATTIGEEPEVYVASGGSALDLALKIDEVVRAVRPDGWRGVQARELVIKAALYGVLQDVAEVERIFLIVKAQTEY